MRPGCESLVARAAGLRAHLLDPAGRQACGRLHTLGGLARELGARGYPVDATVRDTRELETAIRRGAAARLRRLSRWDPAGHAATILLAPEEVRSLRSLARGALEGVPAEARLAGLIPTPALPPAALDQLARQLTVSEIARLLSRWRSPWAEAFAEAHGTEPDLLALESRLTRLLARRTLAAATRGCRHLEEFARESIDLLNLRAAVLLSGRADELDPAGLFVAGGRLTLEAFRRAVAAADATALAARLEPAVADTRLWERLRQYVGQPVLFERTITEWRLARWRRQARTGPLTAAPVIAYVLALQDEVTALQRMVWSIALGVPSTVPGAGTREEAA